VCVCVCGGVCVCVVCACMRARACVRVSPYQLLNDLYDLLEIWHGR